MGKTHVSVLALCEIPMQQGCAKRLFVENFKQKTLTKDGKTCIILRHANVGEVRPFGEMQ
jgi:hypothetical protein